MPLWSLLGGMARGYGKEGARLDEEAHKARVAALEERRARDEVAYRDKSLAAEQQFRQDQFRAQELENAQRADEENRRFEGQQASAERDYRLREAQGKLEHADRVAERNAKANERKEKTKGWTPWQIAMSDLIDQNPRMADEDLATYQERINYLTGQRKALFPSEYADHIKKHPEQDPVNMKKGIIESLFKGVKTQKQAIQEWEKMKARDPMITSLPGLEDEIMSEAERRFSRKSNQTRAPRTGSFLQRVFGEEARAFRGMLPQEPPPGPNEPPKLIKRFTPQQVDSLVRLAPSYQEYPSAPWRE